MKESSTSEIEQLEGSGVLHKAIECFGTANSTTYRIFSRRGRILCALPSHRKTALKTLSLYQPQKIKGQLFKQVIKTSIKLGTPSPFLKQWDTGGQRDFDMSDSGAGFIIGSRGHLCDRAVAVTMVDGGWQVVKMAFGVKAHDILGHEAMMMRKLRAHPYIPDMLSYKHDGDVAQLHTAWQHGRPWVNRDDTLILKLLNCWQTSRNAMQLGDYPEWSHIKVELSKHPAWKDRIQSWESWELIPSICHGDLTRPNLRRGESGELWVHDWERGSLEGLPGLDLAYYLIQDTLFRGQSPVSSLRKVIARLRQEPLRAWIRDIGWKEGVIPLLAATIAYNVDRRFFDGVDLMKALGELGK